MVLLSMGLLFFFVERERDKNGWLYFRSGRFQGHTLHLVVPNFFLALLGPYLLCVS